MPCGLTLYYFCLRSISVVIYKFTITWDFGSAPRSGPGQAKPSEQPGKTVQASIFSIICGGGECTYSQSTLGREIGWTPSAPSMPKPLMYVEYGIISKKSEKGTA
jgi:hypothetical protein